MGLPARQTVLVSDQLKEGKAEKAGWLWRLEANLYSDNQALCPWDM